MAQVRGSNLARDAACCGATRRARVPNTGDAPFMRVCPGTQARNDAGRDGGRREWHRLQGMAVRRVRGRSQVASRRRKCWRSATDDHVVCMARVRRPNLAMEAARRNAEQLSRAGAELRHGRIARHLTQDLAGTRAGIGRGVVSRIERGRGGAVSMDAWQRLGLAVGRPLVVSVQRDRAGETPDAGHLALQELVLRLGRSAGYDGTFELPTRPSEPWRSADVGLASTAACRLLHVECWNTIGDIGAATRSSVRKPSELADLAVARWGTSGVSSLVWVVRSTARNRAIVARYPELFAARFPGSSRDWVSALTTGVVPPAAPGLVWADPAATRIFAWRRPTR
jgi:transcriptional regulator with XRE-family HTH domain